MSSFLSDRAEVIFTPSGESPLVKKIGFFHSAMVGRERTKGQLPLSKELKGDSFRLELGIGWKDSAWCKVISEENGEIRYDFDDLDQVIKILVECGLAACLSYGYTPDFLQTGETHKNQPTDLKAFGELMTRMAAHFREKGLPVQYHEVWNEPDCAGNFYLGSWEDYLKLYEAASQGLLAGDSEAQIGGPSSAYVDPIENRFREFLSFVEEKKLPLDFFSMHSYGEDYTDRIENTRQNLAGAADRFAVVPIHLNEINTVAAPWDYGKECDHYPLAMDMLRCFRDLMDEHDVEVVNWAQLEESGVDALGILNEKGEKKATFHAFRIWSRMPIDRAVFRSEVPGMASFDECRASVVFWNPGEEEQELSVSLKELPGEAGCLSVYQIGREHSSLYDNGESELFCLETMEIKGNHGEWAGKLGSGEVLYLEYNADASAKAKTETGPQGGRYIRKYFYYPDRYSDSYAHFDEHTWTARLSSGSKGAPISVIGAEAEFSKASGAVIALRCQNGMESCAGFRVDYQTGEGYRKAVSFGASDWIPRWGTEAEAEQISENFKEGPLSLSDYAPEGWNGRVIFTYRLENAGPDTRCKITMCH